MSRRRLLALAASLGAAVAGASCGGTAPSGPVSQSGPGGPSSPPTSTPGRILGIIPVPPPPPPTPTPTPLVLRFAHWETGTAGQTLASIGERFGKLNPRVVVQPEVSPFAAHFAQVRASLANGTAPDVFVNSGLYVSDFAGQQALLDLTDRIASDRLALSDYWTEPTTRPIGGRQYTLPVWNATEVVYYNRDHFNELKVAEPPDDWTWDQLLAIAKQLTQGKPGEVQRWGLLLTNDLQGGWGSFVASNGGDWLESTGKQAALQSAPALEALQWFADAMLVHHVAPRPIQQQRLSKAGQIDPFLAGAVSMFPNGTWEMPAVLSGAGFPWDIRPLPRAPRTGQNVTISSVQPVSAARLTQIPDQSWQFLGFLLSREAQAMLATGKVKLPARKDVAGDQSSGYASPPPSHALAASAAMDHATDLHFVPNWQEFRAAVVNALTPAFDGRISVTDAVKHAVSDGNAALAGHK